MPVGRCLTMVKYNLPFAILLVQSIQFSNQYLVEDATSKELEETDPALTSSTTNPFLVEYLNISYSLLEAFDVSSIYNYSLLTVLDITGHNLTSLENIASSSIKELRLEYGQLRGITPRDLDGMTAIDTLRISFNQRLIELRPNASSLANLYADHCSLIDISLDLVPSLQIIDLSHNQISHIMERYFANNQLLKWIDLSFNRITTIEDYAFIRNTLLQKLLLSNNEIEVVDWSMTLKSVEILDLSHNMVTNIEILMLRGVRTLNMSNNRIQSLPEEVARLLPKVTSLILNNNPIRSVGKIKSTTLQTLLLGECKISDIDHKAFYETPNLIKIDISDNKLRHFEFLRYVRNNTEVLLDLNPWQCVCNVTLSVMILCQPSNLTLEDFCLEGTTNEPVEDEPWFLMVTHPVIWAPIMTVAIVVVICGLSYSCYRRRKTRTEMADEALKLNVLGSSGDLIELIGTLPMTKKNNYTIDKRQSENGKVYFKKLNGPSETYSKRK